MQSTTEHMSLWEVTELRKSGGVFQGGVTEGEFGAVFLKGEGVQTGFEHYSGQQAAVVKIHSRCHS